MNTRNKAFLPPHPACFSTAQLGWEHIQVLLLMSPHILILWGKWWRTNLW